MSELSELISNLGFSVVLLAWMIYKDFKFNENILAILREVKEVLIELRTHKAEEAQE